MENIIPLKHYDFFQLLGIYKSFIYSAFVIIIFADFNKFVP